MNSFFKQYQNHRTTPILFHKFYWLMWTTAQIVLGTSSVAAVVKVIDFTDILQVVDLAYSLLTVILMAVYFIGFFKWKLYGWYALMAQLVINATYAFASFFVNYSTVNPASFALIVGTLIRCIPVGIYYYKRKPLFSIEGSDYPAAGFLSVPPQRPYNPYGNPDSQGNPNRQNSSDNMWNNGQNMQENPNGTQYDVNLHNMHGDAAAQPQQAPLQNANFDENGERIYYCPGCGNQVKQTSNFCLYCGTKLK